MPLKALSLEMRRSAVALITRAGSSAKFRDFAPESFYVGINVVAIFAKIPQAMRLTPSYSFLDKVAG